ncbi:Apoptosis-inducing factor 1 [Aphelenchoides bicaudatus]|nr:Apoptosis-inducing factor 1 [Aphelenchoides bicaudatus]
MKALGMFARAAYRQLQVQARRNGHGHAPHNPGPPITWDYSPVPSQPYQNVYNELQTKFNTYLAISAVLFVASFSLALADDVFASAAITRPDSYKKGEPVLVKS